MMESYIAVLTKGICQSEENGSFLSKDFDAQKAYLAGSIKGKQTNKKPATTNKNLSEMIPSQQQNCPARDSLSVDSVFPSFHIFSSAHLFPVGGVHFLLHFLI